MNPHRHDFVERFAERPVDGGRDASPAVLKQIVGFDIGGVFSCKPLQVLGALLAAEET